MCLFVDREDTKEFLEGGFDSSGWLTAYKMLRLRRGNCIVQCL